ncbi:MAG TPA: hypothetical protein PK250_19015 [Syntrophobacter fumaroxidans]|nr:hypothetical protein [Syntrophobacter fumaroxidans]
MSDIAGTDRTTERLPLGDTLALALISGAVIAYELFVMRVFANSGWSHFGSTIVSIAMLGFGVFSTVLCIWKGAFKERMTAWMNGGVILFGPAMTAANSLAQSVPFNPIFLASDANQKVYLGCYFLLYFIPFLIGAMLLGLFFLMGQRSFGKVYFANMCGSGLGGMVLFAAMYGLLPERLYLAPLALWAAGALLWLVGRGKPRLLPALAVSVLVSLFTGHAFVQINVSPYKGVSYARQFPDAKRVYLSASPFGLLEVYSSSYFHFAPGLSDAATLYLDEMPEQAFLGMYIDGDGPIGIMKKLPDKQKEYIRFLPLSMPYLLKKEPEVLVMQFGGGISTNVALAMGARKVTVAEGSPMVIRAVRDSEFIAEFTGRVLANPLVELVPSDGRIYVGQRREAFDIVDLSLADSTGLSMPGGSPIHEKYTYTKETFLECIRALRDGGVLSVTVWNREDPPKSALKLLTTIIKAAGEAGPERTGQSLFIAHTYLSTLTALYKKGGFTAEEFRELGKYCAKMSFEVVWPWEKRDGAAGNLVAVFDAYRSVYFGPRGEAGPESAGFPISVGSPPGETSAAVNTPGDLSAAVVPAADASAGQAEAQDLSAGNLYRLVVDRLIHGDFKTVSDGYVFNTDWLTNDRPYFAGFVKPADIADFADRLEAISDEWGYLLLWATLFLSASLGSILLLLPVAFGWKAFFGRRRGKLGIVAYFLCLGIGYIVIEIGMISKVLLCLGNATVSVAVLITGMLLFSGVGSYVSGRFVSRASGTIFVVCSSIAGILLLYAVGLDPLLAGVGTYPYWARILACLALLFPPAFLMGFPFALGMATLSELGKEEFFVWAWGINGSFSVVGAALAPLLSVLFGLSSILLVSAVAYLVALVSFRGLRKPDVPAAVR